MKIFLVLGNDGEFSAFSREESVDKYITDNGGMFLGELKIRERYRPRPSVESKEVKPRFGSQNS